MTDTYWCVIDGQTTSDAFSVEISATATVDGLKQAIKKRKTNSLSNIDADELILYKALILVDPTDEDKIIKLEVEKPHAKKLRGTARLDTLFPQSSGDEGEIIHIIVKPPQQDTPDVTRSRKRSLDIQAITPKKPRLETNTLRNAIESAGLTDKAAADSQYDLSLLNPKERVSLIEFLGKEVGKADSYSSLSETARAFRKSTASVRESGTISTPSVIPFPVVETKDLFVRETYKDLHDKITSSFTVGHKTTCQNRLVVTGTSGIGKSAFLIYFTIRLLSESDDDSPPIIVFHTKRSSECYVYGGVSTVRYGKIEDFRPLLNLPETWYLVDSSPEPLLDRAKTIISVSPKTLASDTSRYKDVTKEMPRIYYMAPWEQDELEECRSSVRQFNVVSQDLMRKLYTKIGGIPRYVLKSPTITLTRDPGDFAGAELEAFTRVKEAIDYVKDPSALLQCVAQGEEPLLHRWPTNDHENYYLEWASTHIKEELVKQLQDQAWGILLKNLVLGGREIAGGPLFELYVLHIFRKGGITFETKELGEAANPDLLPIQVSPPVEFFRKSEELLRLPESSEGSLFIPTIPNFPCVDMVMAPDKLFQITVSSEHPIKQAPLISIAESILGKNWSEGRKKLGLYFVVPSTIYADFKVQSYSTISGTTSKRQHEIIRQRVKQYALKIDVEAAIAGRSPGSSNSVGSIA